MDINQGYSILKAVMLENGRGFALGLNPKAPQPFVTWACYDDEHGIRQYEWGHYGSDRAALEQDLADRVREYREFYKVNVHHIEAPDLYKYYSTQRPVDIGTYPKPPHNAPDEIVNHDTRIPVEGRPFQAWGHLTYTRPLSNQQMRDYELRPSEDNPDLQRRMMEQAQVVGRWETAEKRPDWKRVTEYSTERMMYMPTIYTSWDQLEYCIRLIHARQAHHSREAPRPIAQQMKDAWEQVEKQQPRLAPPKEAPDRDDR